jgi:hypothetical protein
MFFYGRRRRGVPGLLVAIVAIVLGLTLLFRFRGGAEVSRWIGLAPIVLAALLVVLALIVTLFGLVRPRGKR